MPTRTSFCHKSGSRRELLGRNDPTALEQPHDAVDALVDVQSPEVLFAPHIHELSALWF